MPEDITKPPDRFLIYSSRTDAFFLKYAPDVYKQFRAALTDGSFFADLYILLIQQKVNDIIMDNAIPA